MTVQYAGGTIVNGSFTQSTGTRAELADWIKGELVSAGWASVGSPSDYQVTSATTPQGLSARVRVYDPGSGNCARLKMSNAAGSKVQAGDLFLLPGVAKTWQLIADKYHFWVFTPGASLCREFAHGGTFWTSSFSGVTEAVMGAGNANGDTDTTAQPAAGRINFRVAGSYGILGNNTAGAANWFALGNGTITEANAAVGTQQWSGAPGLIIVGGAAYGGSLGSAVQPFRWFGGGYVAADPLIAWGASQTSEPKVMGQVWDAIWLSGGWSTDQTITFDSHTWQAITNANAGGVLGFTVPGALFVVIA